jgi:hypothetical protein
MTIADLSASEPRKDVCPATRAGCHCCGPDGFRLLTEIPTTGLARKGGA